jgi:hypothetical protein
MTEPRTTGAADARARPSPPRGRRFQPGRSGNPKGGPARPEPRTADVEWLFSRSVEVDVDGKPERLPLARALLQIMAGKALKGDLKVASELLALHGKVEETRAAQAAARARKAAEARDRREEQARWEAENAPLEPPVFAKGDTLGSLRQLGALTWQDRQSAISRWAYDLLVTAAPARWEALDETERKEVLRAVEDLPAGGP